MRYSNVVTISIRSRKNARDLQITRIGELALPDVIVVRSVCEFSSFFSF